MLHERNKECAQREPELALRGLDPKASRSEGHDTYCMRKCSGGGSVSELFLESFIVSSEDE